MSHTLFVTAWPFFLLAWQKCLLVAVTSRVIYMAVGIGKAWLMWPGRAEVVYVSLAVCLSLRGKHRLVLIFRRLWFTTYQMNYWNGIRCYLPLGTPGTPYFSNMKYSNMNFSVTLARYFSESLRVHFWWRRLGQKNTTKCKSKTRLLPWTWRSFSMKCYSRGPEWQGS